MSHNLNVRVSNSIWTALAERSRTSGQSISHIVQAALAEALDIEHHSIFQVSTSGAIVQGLYQGCVSVADLRRHGDVGLGTFEDLDGEMILIDGHCYQARSDGSVVEAADTELTPFASVVNFAPDFVADLTGIATYDDLTAHLDGLRTSENGIVSFKATGTFNSIDLRAACKTESGVDLVAATSSQALFHFDDITGTLVGFWSPEYTKSIAISGYHMHFIDVDRRHGGHVLELATDDLHVEVNDVNDVHLAIPETQAFLEADLAGDHSAALEIAEHERKGN
ncbi:MAG: acetolactate decarboxylase [Actinomycetes bacterium]